MRNFTKYELYTEWRENLPSLILDGGFWGATIERGVGMYGGAREESAHITILTPHPVDDAIENLAENIRTHNDQSAVIMTITPLIGTEVNGR